MPRYFTKDEAERLLVEVRPLMEELQRRKLLFDQLRGEVDAFELRVRGNGHQEVISRLAAKREELAEVGKTIAALVEKVQGLGAEVKDLEQGLVDFRALREGREVYLCWRVGEDGIAWWHSLDTGFGGRQPL